MLRLSSKFKAESFSFHLIVALLVERVLDRISCSLSDCSIIDLIQDTQLEHLAGEVAAVKLDLKDRLIKILELRHCEHMGKQLESYRLEMDLLTKSLESHTQDSVMVERQRRN